MSASLIELGRRVSKVTPLVLCGTRHGEGLRRSVILFAQYRRFGHLPKALNRVKNLDRYMPDPGASINGQS